MLLIAAERRAVEGHVDVEVRVGAGLGVVRSSGDARDLHGGARRYGAQRDRADTDNECADARTSETKPHRAPVFTRISMTQTSSFDSASELARCTIDRGPSNRAVSAHQPQQMAQGDLVAGRRQVDAVLLAGVNRPDVLAIVATGAEDRAYVDDMDAAGESRRGLDDSRVDRPVVRHERRL